MTTPEEAAREILRLREDIQGKKPGQTVKTTDYMAYSYEHAPSLAAAYLDLLKRVEGLEGRGG